MKKSVIIVVPHTSSWDFLIGVAARSICRIRTSFLIKDDFFKNYFSAWFFKSLGGIPVNRKDNTIVEKAVQVFDEHEEIMMTIAPEGTRSSVDHLKTGFYRIATEVNVPIVMVGFDFSKKEVIIFEPFWPTSDKKADMSFVMETFRGVKGRNPELGIL